MHNQYARAAAREHCGPEDVICLDKGTGEFMLTVNLGGGRSEQCQRQGKLQDDTHCCRCRRAVNGRCRLAEGVVSDANGACGRLEGLSLISVGFHVS